MKKSLRCLLLKENENGVLIRMSNRPNVSVIIPVFNREKQIQKCLDSVLNQSLENIEIVCVDDGSIDETPKILDEYAQNDARVKVIHKSNTGYGNSLNEGVKKATGEYIGIVESDDYIESKMYEELYIAAHKNDADIVKADFFVFYENYDYEHVYNILSDKNKDLYNVVTNYKNDRRVFEAYMTSWSGIYKRDFLISNDILHNETPGASFQDNGFWIQTMLYSRKTFFINRPFYHLRRDNADSSVYDLRKIYALCDEYDFMRKCLIKYSQDMDELLPWLWKRRFLSCLSDMCRIGYEYRCEFIERLSNDIKKGVELGEIKKDTVDSKTWNAIDELISNDKLFYEKYYKFKDAAVKRLDDAKAIVVYGAGAYATRIIGDIQTSRFADKLVSIAVTSKEGNPVIKSRLKVQEIKEGAFPKDALFIISIKQGIEEIEAILKKNGYSNYMSCYELHDLL